MTPHTISVLVLGKGAVSQTPVEGLPSQGWKALMIKLKQATMSVHSVRVT